MEIQLQQLEAVGAGAGIGGNGGDGSQGKNGVYIATKQCEDGEAGESCGEINIYNSVTVYAYGGARRFRRNRRWIQQGRSWRLWWLSSSRNRTAEELGGAGSTCCAGAGGYSGGSGSGQSQYSVNGLCGYGYARASKDGTTVSTDADRGGGYFQGPTQYTEDKLDESILFGGRSSNGFQFLGHEPGNGGTGGSGGNITVSSNAKVYAFNGNLYTDGTSYEDGLNQCPFYAQAGIITAKYEYSYNEKNHFAKTYTLISAQSTVSTSGYVNSMYTESNTYADNQYLSINDLLGVSNNPLSNVDMSTQGVGSGAGYIEVSNGTYNIDSSMNTSTQ